MSRQPGSTPGGDARALLQQGFERHKAGNLRKAERLYAKAIKANPRDPDALYLYGLLAKHQGNPSAALERFDRALAVDPDDVRCRSDRAEALAMLGRLDDAEAALKETLRLAPGTPPILNNLGNVLAEQGRDDDAIAAFRDALKTDPGFAPAHAGLGTALARDGRFEDARRACETAVGLGMDAPDLLTALGSVLTRLGRPTEALAPLERALTAAPEDELAWVALAEALCGAVVGVRDRDFTPLIGRCLGSDFVRPDDIAPAAAAAIRLRCRLPDDPVDAAGISIDDDLLTSMAQDNLLAAYLTQCLNVDPVLEVVLGRLRRTVFAQADAGPVEALAAALAEQGFANEYVHPETAEERDAVDAVGRRLAERTGADDFPTDEDLADLAWFALYRPLSSLDGAKRLAAVDARRLGPTLAPLVERQIAEPAEEAAIAADLPRIGAIDDAVSRAVAAQYEDNPYPRWTRVPRSTPERLDDAMARLFPHAAAPASFGGPVDVLVAGCGTGRHPIGSVAMRFPEARVMAIDLSRTSLAYAVRKARTLGVDRIEFAHADILALGDWDRRFDLIEAAGVLHHMNDPLTGWAILRDLLKPEGAMIVGLYSEAARAPIVAARERIAALGLSGSADDIRAFRQRLLTGPERADPAFASLTGSPDFYSVSGCRDLLFHVQEHRFTLPQIGGALDTLGLELIGFEDERPEVWRRYRGLAPDDGPPTDLAVWAELEAQDPETFRGMYQFWCRRRPE